MLGQWLECGWKEAGVSAFAEVELGFCRSRREDGSMSLEE